VGPSKLERVGLGLVARYQGLPSGDPDAASFGIIVGNYIKQEDGKLAVYWEGECRFQTTDEQRDDIQGIHMEADGDFVI
jgi:hypothetical protein